MSAMAIKDVFKISRKTFFNPGAWLGLNELTAYNRVITSTLKTTFTPEKSLRTETFEQALERLNVTDADLQQTAKIYRWYALFFLMLSVVSFLVAFYYLFEFHTVAGWVLAMSVSMLFGANAFRFDFWYFQIQHRKLGCTVAEWWSGKPGAPKDPSV
jgi:intracellular multiplication protein IcmV